MCQFAKVQASASACQFTFLVATSKISKSGAGVGNSWRLGGRGGWVPDKIQNFDGGGGWWWVNFQKINGGGGWVMGLKISYD